MKKKNKKAFTLVELLMAMLAGAIVILATGTAIKSGHTYWDDAWTKANLQRDATYMMEVLTGPIRMCNWAETENNGTSIKLHSDGTWTRYYWDQDDNTVKKQLEAEDPEIVLYNVTGLSFTVQVTKVTMSITVSKGSEQSSLDTTVMIRNYSF